MAPRIFIFSIVLGSEYLSYVKSVATYAPTFFGYIISVLASLVYIVLQINLHWIAFQTYNQAMLYCDWSGAPVLPKNLQISKLICKIVKMDRALNIDGGKGEGVNWKW